MMTAAEKSGKTGRLGRLSLSVRRGARLRRGVVLAASLALIGIGIARRPSAADDDHLAPRQRSEAGPRVYMPLHPADPAQVNKRSEIGLDPAFRQEHDRGSPRDRNGPPRNSIRASGTGAQLRAGTAK
jgi:hypothetical protein